MTSLNEFMLVSNQRLGRRAPLGRSTLHLSRYFTGFSPTLPPASASHLGVKAWALGANTKYSTCGPTSAANFTIMSYKYLTGEDITVTDDAVFDLYRRSGNPRFNTLTGSDDNGVEMSIMLDAWLAGGLEITHEDGTTELVKPYCHAALSVLDIVELQLSTSIFGATLQGLNLTAAQQTQQSLWDYVPGSPPWGGHAVASPAYTGAQTGLDITDITWGAPIGTTDAFILKQLEEAHVPILPILANHPDFIAGVNKAALASDYEAITGRPIADEFNTVSAPPPRT